MAEFQCAGLCPSSMVPAFMVPQSVLRRADRVIG